VNNDDELKDLDADTLSALRHPIETPPESFRTFANPTELLLIFREAPIQRAVDDARLSSCLRRCRTEAKVHLDDLATALNQPSELLRQFESRDSLPWTLPPQVLTDLAYTFRLHLSAIEALTHQSFFLTKISGLVPDEAKAADSISSWLAQVRLSLELRGAEELLS
jgi:hypothetical protein